jgi:hypothetical protein
LFKGLNNQQLIEAHLFPIIKLSLSGFLLLRERQPTPTQLAFVHWRGLSPICPANPSPPPRFLCLIITTLQRTSSFIHTDYRLPVPSIPKQPGA